MPQSGGVAERSKALVLKTSDGNSSQGSNPCPSAKMQTDRSSVRLHFDGWVDSMRTLRFESERLTETRFG